MKTLEQLITQIKTEPEATEFQPLIDVIDRHYHYTATAFSNGPDEDCVVNAAGTNEGSCKIFSFASLHQLDEIQTLNCFGHYYRQAVLQHPLNTDHKNIRHFMRYGWQHLRFEKPALLKKPAMLKK